MASSEALERGRTAYAGQAWADAFGSLTAADVEHQLDVVDLERLAEVSYLVGREAEAIDAWVRAHRAWLHRGEPARAARSAFWVALALVLRGDEAQAGGWLARAQRLVDDAGGDCVEQGYLLMMAGKGQFEEGDVVGASDLLRQAAEIGTRFRDADLLAFSRMGSGQALVWRGRTAEGLALLDEAMVSVTAGEVSAIASGIVYCALIEACHDAFDLRRAGEWTQALTNWCAAQPDLVPYRGNCQAHRAEVLVLRGRWDEAGVEAATAVERLSDVASAGTAHYQRGEVHRLRGEFASAARSFGLANDLGRVPQPGLALLALAEERVDAAAAMVRRLLDETKERVARARLLGAAVEILLVAGDPAGARAAADELSGLAAAFAAPLLHAAAGSAAGAVLLAEGNPHGACETLRRAVERWRALDVPYEVARTRVLLAVACGELGDADGAVLELDGARTAFTALGAAPALAALERLAGTPAGASAAGPLTAREVEVLVLLATGVTNRAIAARLVISDKTVARHVSNIFTKLGLSSRSAATAYAYEHRLV